MTQNEFDTKKRAYEISVRYSGFFGHRYHGFDGYSSKHGYGYSQSETDNRANALVECEWVWDHKSKKWIKTPSISS